MEGFWAALAAAGVNPSDAVLAAGSSVSLLLTFLGLRRRGRLRGGSPAASRAGGADAVDQVVALLGRRLEGVSPLEPPARGWRRVSLREPVAPEGFGGQWRVALLGCGGWGCAFLGEREGLRVVFKVPRGFESLVTGEGVPGTVDPRFLGKIAGRAAVLERLRHPHLLRLLGYSRAAPLLVYEYADGGTLWSQLAGGWEPGAADVALLGAQLGDALRYIHSRGLVHGDVKPTNVFVVDGLAKLGDFSGLTSLLASTSMVPSHATPGWRAPEQVYSDLKRAAIERGVENRVDVYQLGNLLLYLLTGEALDGSEALNPEDRAKLLSGVGDDRLRGLLEAMLQPEPWRRPSAEEAAKSLAAAYAGAKPGQG